MNIFFWNVMHYYIHRPESFWHKSGFPGVFPDAPSMYFSSLFCTCRWRIYRERGVQKCKRKKK